MLPQALEHLSVPIVMFALASLLIVRPLAIGLSLAGTGLDRATKAFFGWFGPRGLASILFALLIVEGTDLVHGETIFNTVMIAVFLSTVLHGITAAPFARRYGARNSETADTP